MWRTVLLGATLLSAGAAQAADQISKDCGPKGHYVIGFAQANYAEPYRQHVNNDLLARAKSIPQFELKVSDGAGNDNTQTSQVDNYITQQVDLLLISPFEAAPLTPAITRAMKAGIPVIELDRASVGTAGKDYTAFVGGDNYKIAYEAGTFTAKTLLPGGGEVAVIEGLPSSTPAIERLQGFKDGIKQNPKLKLVAEQAGDWLPEKATTIFSAMLQSHPDIRALYASNDLQAAGAYVAAKGAGKEKQIAIIGTDGLPGPSGGIAAVANGQWAATFVYPTGAEQALDLAKKILLDCASSVPATVTVPTTAITKENAAKLNETEKF